MEEEVKRGRRPVEDKKVRVTIYVRQSHIKVLGGASECQRMASEYLEGLVGLMNNTNINQHDV